MCTISIGKVPVKPLTEWTFSTRIVHYAGMADVVLVSGSPNRVSRTDAVLAHVAWQLSAAGHATRGIAVRELPAGALLSADPADPEIAAAVAQIATADAVVVATPVYKAGYTGVLKTFLDLLPQFALAGKTVLPLATGGSPAHVLVVDYALRPVLTSLGADHVTQGWFVLADEITPVSGGFELSAEGAGKLAPIVRGFLASVESNRRRHRMV